jgi:hypothetical protein
MHVLERDYLPGATTTIKLEYWFRGGCGLISQLVAVADSSDH